MKLSALFIALVPLLGSPVIHAETTAAPVLENRAAQGDITTPGGARRLTGDQTEALRASLINKPAKNVILLIGDGMGDSEITAARNYAQGAGGFFKGIDALPLTGQYTHYSLDKKTGKPDYVTDSAASATAWTTGVKTYNGALGVDIHENAHQTILEQAEARGYQIVTDAASLAAATDASQAKPLLGLFADGNMPVRWEGPKASYHGNIDKAPVTCTPNPKRDASVPTLAQMTEKAIDLLSRNEKGFFLQVEGASIDKQDHAANPCGQIGETVDLDEAVQKALEFARKDGNTLVIVTADHAHASQIIPADSKAPGLTQALNTHDGAVMVMSYGNSEEESMEHTGTQLRIAAYGPHAANVVGLTDQTDLFSTMKAALSLK
ncbi:hypothetical protein DMT40_00565 [Klebsiella variicola]|nr:hypothetical protein DMT40_00565 [Klebsiella variicola]